MLHWTPKVTGEWQQEHPSRCHGSLPHFRPLAGIFEPIKKSDPASTRKMITGGGLNEIITFPSWLIDPSQSIIAIPTKNCIAWSSNICQLNSKRTITHQELSSLIGRLSHVCFITPDARHLMVNLRRMEATTQKTKGVKLYRWTLNGSDLWLNFLESEKAGISISRVIFRKPTLTTFFNSSAIEIGGF